MKSFVIDTGVLALFFAGDTKVKPYFKSMEDGTAKGYITSVNLSEFYYKTCQKLGSETAEIRYHQCLSTFSGVETDPDLSLAAGVEKCHKNTLALADCYEIALAKRLKATLLTTDSELAKNREITIKLFDWRSYKG
jgi:hypothetical protein